MQAQIRTNTASVSKDWIFLPQIIEYIIPLQIQKLRSFSDNNITLSMLSQPITSPKEKEIESYMIRFVLHDI